MLTIAPTTNRPSSQLFDSTTPRSARLGTSPPIDEGCSRKAPSQTVDNRSMGRSCNFATVGSGDPVVEITPSHIVKRRFTSWRHMAAEVVQTTSQDRMEYRFEGRRHMLAICERCTRRDGEAFVDGLRRSTLRDTSRKLLFIPAGHNYYEWQEPRTPVHVTYFYFEDPLPADESEICDMEASLCPRLYFDDVAIWGTAYKLKRLVESPRSEDQLYAESLGALLVHELMRLNRGEHRVELTTRGGLSAWQQRIAVSYIEEHLAEPISLPNLAGLVRLSPYYFCRAFKKSLGLPPHRYHTSRRIEHAKTLLAEPSSSVTDIALTVGFSETSSFTAAFRKGTGLTPTAYRRSFGK